MSIRSMPSRPFLAGVVLLLTAVLMLAGTLLLGRPSAGAAATSEQVEARNLAVAKRFMNDFFNKQDLSAADRAIGPVYRQHNPQAPDGKAALKAIFADLFTQYPKARFAVIKRAAADGDLVFIHSVSILKPGAAPAQAALDVFRFRAGKIVEHWDVTQDYVVKTVSGRPMA